MPANARSLGVEDIVAAAQRVAVNQGFSALTMRALADELGVSAMAAYHYVPNKDALVLLAIDSALAGVEIPPSDFGDWSQRLRELQDRTTDALSAWPGLDALVYDREPTAQGWRLMDAYFEVLLDAGFTPRNAVLAFNVIRADGLGRSSLERQFRGSQDDHERQRQKWPTLSRVNSAWKRLHRADFEDAATDVIMDGLRAMLAAQENGTATPKRRRPTRR
jgi:AcrR family transcriptional regulator